MSDDQIERVLEAYAQRILDLKRDPRFKYVTVFQNRGALAGAEWSIRIPRSPPRCSCRGASFTNCGRLANGMRRRSGVCSAIPGAKRNGSRAGVCVDTQGDYVAFCPYASRVPFELWLMLRPHNHLFERPRPVAKRHDLAALLGRVLRRLTRLKVVPPRPAHRAEHQPSRERATAAYWRTLAEDFHWHIEILPIVEQRSKVLQHQGSVFQRVSARAGGRTAPPARPKRGAEAIRFAKQRLN